jgi:hypothetical protein
MADQTITTQLEQLDIREKLAHIDQMLADHDRKRQEIRVETWKIAIAVASVIASSMAAGAALFAAGAAYMKLFS